MHVLITGVSSGLGEGLARAFLGRGSLVYGVSRREPEELREDPGFHFHLLDLTHFDSIGPALDELLSGVRRLDLVVLNAGVLGHIQDMREADLDSLRHTMDVNLWANKVVMDHLLEKGPALQQVVAISSGASLSGQRGWSGYGLSKAALNMLVKLYASEVPDVHFTALAPGLIDTAMQHYISEFPNPEKFPAVERLRRARGTEAMPDPVTAAERIIDALPRILRLPSGSYADIRELGAP